MPREPGRKSKLIRNTVTVGIFLLVLVASVIDYRTGTQFFQIAVPCLYLLPVLMALLISRLMAVGVAAVTAVSAGFTVFLKGQIVYPESTVGWGVLLVGLASALALYFMIGSLSKAVVNREQAEQRAGRLQEVLFGVISSLSRVLDARDRHTARHSQSVAEYALAIAKEMDLSPAQQETIYCAGLLHDVGKIGISEQPLMKPGRLTPQEWEEIKRHPELSYRILRDIPELEEIAVITLYHHERWDGGDYPYGVRDDNIPIGARILCVADSFDAMISERVYKSPMSKEGALEELKRCGGTQFDPGVVAAFLRCYEKGIPTGGFNSLKGPLNMATI